MKLLTVTAFVALMASCQKPVPVPTEWATTVSKPTDPVHAACQQNHQLTEPQGTSGSALVRFGSAAADDFAKLKADYDKCATWARGQRK